MHRQPRPPANWGVRRNNVTKPPLDRSGQVIQRVLVEGAQLIAARHARTRGRSSPASQHGEGTRERLSSLPLIQIVPSVPSLLRVPRQYRPEHQTGKDGNDDTHHGEPDRTTQ